MIKLYRESLPVFHRAFHLLESKIEKPVIVQRGSYPVLRYKHHTVEAAVIQKLARLISGLHASLLLLQGGFAQEIGVIFRSLDEFHEDIFFLCQAIKPGELTKLHEEYLESFYQEEFDLPDNPLLSEQKRPTIPRKKIHAAIAQIPENELNPSDSQQLYRTLSQAYSGYVHGASGHIMEMYGGNPPRYHLAGMNGTSRITEVTDNYWDYFYRGLLSLMMVAASFGDQDLLNNLNEFRAHIEEKSGKRDWEHPEKMIRNIKQMKP